MQRLIRTLLLSFVAFVLGSYIYALRNQHARESYILQQQEGAKILVEQEQKNCQQFMAAKYCTAPLDRADRWTCSERLAENHCDKYMDVGYLVLDVHRGKYDTPKEDWYSQIMNKHFGIRK